MGWGAGQKISDLTKRRTSFAVHYTTFCSKDIHKGEIRWTSGTGIVLHESTHLLINDVNYPKRMMAARNMNPGNTFRVWFIYSRVRQMTAYTFTMLQGRVCSFPAVDFCGGRLQRWEIRVGTSIYNVEHNSSSISCIFHSPPPHGFVVH